ncbi:ABC transporter substrate-binding protein [Pseudorhodoferax sp. Leaf267]|uniref:ABC transporter substrate-binding protein n=1 Tax=Pseudorhodoferax sp. Leaf267 TaxID=1736316 RepID=UPI0006FCBAB4|nr:ABC transporter substrate-binding protein [Pseudorhodoferax sp. Leaf267]KQP17673.1 branched-chain amino acid ABC transporter substrate-binding protein [Pseudorhodoferax sp. Leaf267]
MVLRIRPPRAAAALTLALAALCPSAHALDCGANTGKPATGTPLPIGSIVGKTGPDDFSIAGTAAAAYFQCVNDNGGIHGRPVQYIVMDDQWNPKIAASAATQLLDQRQVVAMVGSSSFVECQANVQRYADAGIVVIGGAGVERTCFHSSSYAPLNTGPRISATIAGQFAAGLGPTRRMACIIPDIPGLRDWACSGVQDWGRKQGIEVEVVTVKLGGFSAREVLEKTVSRKPDVIVMNLDKAHLLPMMAAAQAMDLGRSIRFASSAPAYNMDVARALGPYWKDAFHANLEFRPLDHDGPDMRNWTQVLDRYAPKTIARNAFSQSGYLAARLATEAMLKLPPDQLDRANINAAFRRVDKFESDMLCRPYYIGKGKRHNASYSGPMARFNGQDWTMAGAGCVDAADPELADILAEERRAKRR